MAEPRPILLDAYAARNCAVKTQNEYDGSLPADIVVLRGHSENLQEIFVGSDAYDKEILDYIADSVCNVLDLRELHGTACDVRRDTTAEAVAEGIEVIIKPILPFDLKGHRKGNPDLLVRGEDRSGKPGYYPVQCKRSPVFHAQTNSSRAVSLLSAPCHRFSKSLSAVSVRENREDDLMQLAHYWRVLEANDWQSGGTPLGGIIGRDRLASLVTPEDTWYQPTNNKLSEQFIAWCDLTNPRFRTFSRTAEEGFTHRHALDRYDHEFGFRIQIAAVAAQRTGDPSDPELLVHPIVNRECATCQWWRICLPKLDDDDLSLRISTARLDVREISVLRSLGINTVSDLAEVDLERLLPQYLPEVTHRDFAEDRIRRTAHRASLLAHDIALERTTEEPINCPRSSYEIDFDIETSSSGKVYLWGFLVTDRASGQAPRYVPFSRFSELDSEGEHELAMEALNWLGKELIEHPDALIYHYSDYELTNIRRITRQDDPPEVLSVLDQIGTRFVDLFLHVRRNFFGAEGLGLKIVASAGPGFSWRDEDPSGLNSIGWFSDAINDPDPVVRAESTQRILHYNEDDCRATAALREWLSDEQIQEEAVKFGVHNAVSRHHQGSH